MQLEVEKEFLFLVLFLSMRVVLMLFFFYLIFSVKGQQDSIVTSDSLKLPFKISGKKRLSDEDLKNKREGTYVTGLPNFSSDPVNGFGYGGDGFIIFNGKRKDPFFAYTPYLAKLQISLFNTTKQQREFGINLDVPYFLKTKWRLRVMGEYQNNPNPLYFGMNEGSLKGLSYYPDNDSTQNAVTNASFENYENSFSGDNENYNTYELSEQELDINFDRNFLDGKLRILVGYEIGHIKISSFPGISLLKNDFDNGSINGLGSFITSIVQSALIYDTRDFETDPSRGIFAEVFNEFSSTALGSNFNFNKTFVHFNGYTKVLPKVFKKMVFACRFGFGVTSGNAPFYEYRDQPSSEGDIEALGGPSSLRGYKENRFIGRITNFNNIELRYRFCQFKVLKQHIGLSGVPFFDVGGIWNNFASVLKNNNFRYCEGLGLRIAWNVNTVIRLDYAISKEDKQFFLAFNHSF